MFFWTLATGRIGGGSSSSDDDSSQSFDNIPSSINLEDVALTAGVPTTLTVTLPKPPNPYTEVTIDIGRMFEEANIDVIAR